MTNSRHVSIHTHVVILFIYILYIYAYRRHASFFGLLPDEELLDSFKVSRSELPVLYLIAEGGDSLIPFPGMPCL